MSKQIQIKLIDPNFVEVKPWFSENVFILDQVGPKLKRSECENILDDVRCDITLEEALAVIITHMYDNYLEGITVNIDKFNDLYKEKNNDK